MRSTFCRGPAPSNVRILQSYFFCSTFFPRPPKVAFLVQQCRLVRGANISRICARKWNIMHTGSLTAVSSSDQHSTRLKKERREKKWAGMDIKMRSLQYASPGAIALLAALESGFLALEYFPVEGFCANEVPGRHLPPDSTFVSPSSETLAIPSLLSNRDFLTQIRYYFCVCFQGNN